MDAPLCQRKLVEWTEKVRWETVKAMDLFEKRPGDYCNSRNFFRALTLITVLQQDCGVHYNPAKIPEDVPFETADSFIFGIIQGNGGTCTTIPVLYAAIGRRLGYPLKLVKAVSKQYTHFFVRWDGDGARFNMEGTAQGLSCPPDSYYRTGRYAVSAGLEEASGLLTLMSPRQELAEFTNERLVPARGEAISTCRRLFWLGFGDGSKRPAAVSCMGALCRPMVRSFAGTHAAEIPARNGSFSTTPVSGIFAARD